jgi:diguanylate cyclase (GGDEF)-like protein
MSLQNKTDALMEWLMPAHLGRDVHALKRVRMFLFSHLFGPLLGLQVPAAMYLIDPSPFPHVPVLAASIAGFWLFVPLLKCFAQQFKLWAHLSIANLNFAVLWGSYYFGGANSPFLIWYMLLPILAFFYLGSSKVARIAVFAQVVVGLGAFLAAHVMFGHPTVSHLSAQSLLITGVVSTLLATTYAFFMAAYYASVVDSQSELLKEIERHEHTLKELTHSKQQMDLANQNLIQVNQLVEARNEQLEAARADLEHLAMHDSLTGLPNRRYLDVVLADCAMGMRDNPHIALMHIDLDRFKQINDTLGHAAGDAVLVHVAGVLQQSSASDDFIARIGGDEFVVLNRMQDATPFQLATQAKRFIEHIRQPIPYGHHLCRTGASVGIAMQATAQGMNPKQLLVNADTALYRAKDKGKNRCEFFTEEMQQQVVLTKQLADDILRGIEQQEFTAYYQPKVHAVTRQVVGMEALVRWVHPVRGVLGPEVFLKVAEELNAVNTIDRMMFEQALVQFKRWQAWGLGISAVSINMSMWRLNDPELLESLCDYAQMPGTVSFELLESIFLDDAEEIVSLNIERLKALGIDIEIDDFGTGHASIAGLLKLKPKRLKIDRQFVSPIVASADKRRLISAMIDMAKALNIEVVAEGVETLEQAQILQDLGCNMLQGYVFSRPMPATDVEAFVRAYTQRLRG